jgi:hypothetical protein
VHISEEGADTAEVAGIVRAAAAVERMEGHHRAVRTYALSSRGQRWRRLKGVTGLAS